MRGSLQRTQRGNHPSYEGTWSAVVATDAGDVDEMVDVIIPAFSSVLSWGPCRWTPRGASVTYPQRGDECIVAFDDQNRPWIVGWWPF